MLLSTYKIKESGKMNKSNKILIGVLSFVVVCVVGYALFSETITVTGTATASGDFSFEKKCFAGDSRNVYQDLKQGGYGTESCTVNGDTVSISTELLYPSAFRVYTIEIKNTGAIDGMVKVNEELFPDQTSTLQIKSVSLELYNKSDNALYKTYNYLTDDTPGDYGETFPAHLALVTKEGQLLITDELLLASGRVYQKSSEEYYLKIKPGDTILQYVFASWDESAKQTDYYSKFKFNVELNIEQFVEDGLTPATDISSCYNGC